MSIVEFGSYKQFLNFYDRIYEKGHTTLQGAALFLGKPHANAETVCLFTLQTGLQIGGLEPERCHRNTFVGLDV